MNANELQHFGILGMKWGIRRYQNKDGSLTPKGKRRYGEEDGPSNKKLPDDKTGTTIYKTSKEWTDAVNKDWLEIYNKAADRINSDSDNFLKDLNARWEKKWENDPPGVQTDFDKYEAEYDEHFEKLYMEEATKKHGENPDSKKVKHSDSLIHYGVLGMKWGIRRTPDQLARASKKRGDWSDEAKDLKTIRSKKVKSLSNAELRRANERLNLEKNYRDLTPQSIRQGMSYLTGAVTLTAGILSIYKNYGSLVKVGKKIVGR